MTVHNLLFCIHALCMNYETNTLLLVSSSVRSKQPLSFVHGQGQKSIQQHTTKSFDEFHNHSPLLTMISTKRECLTFSFCQLIIKFQSADVKVDRNLDKKCNCLSNVFSFMCFASNVLAIESLFTKKAIVQLCQTLFISMYNKL